MYAKKIIPLNLLGYLEKPYDVSIATAIWNTVIGTVSHTEFQNFMR